MRTLGCLQNRPPDFDGYQPGEPHRKTALRLGHRQSPLIGRTFARALIIGADQVAVLQPPIGQLGKSESVAKAEQMLAELSGQTITFYSALCLLNSEAAAYTPTPTPP